MARPYQSQAGSTAREICLRTDSGERNVDQREETPFRRRPIPPMLKLIPPRLHRQISHKPYVRKEWERMRALPIDSVPTLALLHTSPSVAPVFSGLCQKHLPEFRIFHMADESLIQETMRAGRLRKSTARRVVNHVGSAVEAGADAVLVTCSSIGQATRIAQQLFDLPILRVDEAMAEAAVRQACVIGVAATVRTTLDPTLALLREKAQEAGREVKLVECLSEAAFPAILAGDTAKHDALVSKALLEELQGVDLIVLAQASMARVVDGLPAGALRVPVLTSPELAVLRARQALQSLGQAEAGD